jgi:CDP-diacylglycerol--serine O-phosphatidyltransferase
MLQSKYRYLIPNGITFLSLTCGIISILASASGELYLGGVLILTSYVLDLFDGELARRLKAGSAFGLQLDSLVDMVSLGTAPAVLAFFHLQGEGGVAAGWLWPCVILFPLAGAFRLARFNLLPVKTSTTEIMGLTISTAGATLTLSVLSDIAYSGEIFPNISFIPLIIALASLMVSRITFPPLAWVFSRRRLSYLLVLLFGASVYFMPSFANAWLVFTGGYIGVGLARAGLERIRD